MNKIKNIAIACILAAGGIIIQQNYKTETSIDTVVYQHIKKAEVTSSTFLEKNRAVQRAKVLTPIERALMRIDAHLRAGEHLEVLAQGEAVLEQDPSNLDVLLRQGIVYLQEQDYTLAYEQLKTVYDAPTSVALKSESAWYLALLQAQNRSWAHSKRYLKDVLQMYTPYRRSAEELLVLIDERMEA